MIRKQIPIPWVRHLRDQDSKDKLAATLLASATALSRLYDLIEETERDLLNKDASEADFTNPNWAFKQAFRNGQRAQIKELKQLLAFTRI